MQRKFLWFQVRPVAQHDDRQPLRGEALKNRAESHGAAGMPHARAALEGIEKPSKSVRDRLRSIVQLYRGQRHLCFRFAQEGVAFERAIPLRQVFEIRINTAIALSRRSRTLVRLNEMVPLLRVPVGASGDRVLSLDINQRVTHVQRLKDAVVQELG